MSRIRSVPAELARYAAIVLLGVYRAIVSPLLHTTTGAGCRFTPSCSKYAADAIALHGPMQGGMMAVRRLLRCRPGGGWGFDPVKSK